MTRLARLLAVVAVGALLACENAAAVAAAAPATAASAQGDLTWEEVDGFRRSHDAFALHERLERAGGATAAATRFGRALEAHAFHDPARSNAIAEALLEENSVPDSLIADLRMLAINNHLHRFEYTRGLAVAEALVADSARTSATMLHDARNYVRILRALKDVPAQTLERRGESRIPLAQGRIPVSVGDSLRHYIFDTGANLSTIMRSEAEAVGLRIVPAGIEVGTSTDRRVTADLGIASRLVIGAMEFENVVFLVMDDSLLTFGDIRIDGIIGFPLIGNMGEVRLIENRELFVPAEVPARTSRNLALHGLELLTIASWDGENLLCRFDTGASDTQLYEPAYRRLAARIDERSRVSKRRVGGAGGVRELPVRVIQAVQLEVGGAVAKLDSVDVILQSIAANENDNYLDANLGHDIFDQFDEIVINFRDMAMLLRSPRKDSPGAR